LSTLRKAALLFWLMFVLDFATSAFFIALGYGSAESNRLQVTLLAAPSVNSLFSWALNQDVWLLLGAAGVLALAYPRAQARWLHLDFLLVLFSVVRLYGVAANVAFTLQATLGLSLALWGYYALLCVPLILLFRGEIRSLGPILSLRRVNGASEDGPNDVSSV
jgi:hypothetical protein